MLTIQSLSKSYIDNRAGVPERLSVLRDINLSIPHNQFVCLLVASGCGKTTLLRIVAGLIDEYSGEVTLDSQTISGPGSDRAMVFQNYGLLPWRTVLGNVEFGLEMRGVAKKKRREIARACIERVGLGGFEDHYPHQISGGMQQRTALARAFSKNPKILLMDEPFAAVDMQTRENLQTELLTIWNTVKTTVLFVTHSVEEAIYLGDRVVVMGARPGHVKADITTNLPRPRTLNDMKTEPRFAHLAAEIRELLHSPSPGAGNGKY